MRAARLFAFLVVVLAISLPAADARFAAAWASRRGEPLKEVPVAPPVFNGHPRFARPYSLAIIHYAIRAFHNGESNEYARANAKIAENCRFYIENTDAECDGTKTWRIYESENHHVQRASALWQLMHVLLKADAAYGERVLGHASRRSAGASVAHSCICRG